MGLENGLSWQIKTLGQISDRPSLFTRHPAPQTVSQAFQPAWYDFLPSLDPDVFLPSPYLVDPDFPSFNSQRLDQQVQLYANYLATLGPPDVLIVGSSRSLQGIDPHVLQEALAARGYADLKIYNFGVNGATAQVVDVVLRRILTPEQLPRLILWGDGSRAFNSGRVDRTYNSIIASEGYKRLEAGLRPIQVRQPTFLMQTYESCLALHTGEVAIATPPPSCLVTPQTYDRPGSRAVTEVSNGQAIAADLTENGFQRVMTQFNPATYYRQFPQVSGRYDTNYVPFRLDGEQSAATVTIANFAQAHQIPLVFVNLPLTGEYLDPVRRDYEQQFRQHMQQQAAREGFVFRDLLNRWLTQNEYFADPSHLNQAGARAVALQLAADPSIPWPLPRLVDSGGAGYEQ
jgi:lysophospholipase L1-like esterase